MLIIRQLLLKQVAHFDSSLFPWLNDKQAQNFKRISSIVESQTLIGGSHKRSIQRKLVSFSFLSLLEREQLEESINSLASNREIVLDEFKNGRGQFESCSFDFDYENDFTSANPLLTKSIDFTIMMRPNVRSTQKQQIDRVYTIDKRHVLTIMEKIRWKQENQQVNDNNPSVVKCSGISTQADSHIVLHFYFQFCPLRQILLSSLSSSGSIFGDYILYYLFRFLSTYPN